MTILQYNVNNHILDDAHFLRWPSVLPDSETVSLLSKGLLNLEPRLCSSGYAPVYLTVIKSPRKYMIPLLFVLQKKHEYK